MCQIEAPATPHPNEFGGIRQWNYKSWFLFKVFPFNIDINSPTYIKKQIIFIMAAKNIDMIEMQIDALVKAGYYHSISDITKSAFRVLLESKSDLKVASAVELYKMGKISLSRGAEIAGVSLEEFKEVLADRGVVRTLSPSPDIDANVARILEGTD